MQEFKVHAIRTDFGPHFNTIWQALYNNPPEIYVEQSIVLYMRRSSSAIP